MFWTALGVTLSLIGPALSSHQFGAQGVNKWLRNSDRFSNGALQTEAQLPLTQSNRPTFHQDFFIQPLDHFDKRLNVSFGQRFWVNDRHYVKGGPVIVLDGGETDGEGRLPFLDTGIVDILANATNGLGIVLEHRYYGASIPVENFTTDSLRWLNNAQSLEDSAQFISHFKWNGKDLSAPKTRWIYYGGSYAGARAAHMRVLYPDLVFGAIASSAVTVASIDYWEYMEAIRISANQTCIGLLTEGVALIDHLLSIPLLNGHIKSSFSLSGLDDQDFVSVLQEPLGSVQAQNWDPSVSTDAWDRFCHTLGSGQATSKIAFIRSRAVVKNYAKWIREEVVKDCLGDEVDCFGTRDPSKFQDSSLSQTWRAWVWQVCNEWGYFIGAPPDPAQPRIVSRRLTLDYTSQICRQAFPDGKHARVPVWPNVTVVNELGGFDLSRDRLAFVDGDSDPWRPATPHSWYATPRADTIDRPFKIIPGGVHHHDENGLQVHANEPETIQTIHAEEIAFVQAWLASE